MKDDRSAVSGWNSTWKSVESAFIQRDTYAQERALAKLRARVRNGASMPLATASRLLQLLKSRRCFSELVEIADLIGAFDSELPSVRKTAAQGLIETGQLDRAIRELEKTRKYISRIMPVEGTNPQVRIELRPELAEVQGLLGRVYKQRCVDAADEGVTPRRIDDARKSMRFYWDAYKAATAENLWHGINYVAVASYAKKHLRIDPPGRSAQEVARDILGWLAYVEEQQQELTAWDCATRGEAALAVGNGKLARACYEAYLARDLEDFQKGSSRRQLEELWGLTARHGLIKLFARAEAGPLPAPAKRASRGLQSRIHDAKYSRLSKNPQARANSTIVARLGRDVEEGEGSGFLFDGAWLSPKLEGKVLLLTCAHVCSIADPIAIRPMNLTVYFSDGESKMIAKNFVEQLWCSPRHELDATLLLLRWGPHPLPKAKLAEGTIQVKDRTYIISHPWGGAKMASLEQNAIREVGKKRFYYLTATDPGSSGAPVFNDKWQLIGIHRAGPEDKKMNEGTRLDLILAEMKTKTDAIVAALKW